MMHEPLLALIADLYSQVSHLGAENAQLRQMLAAQDGGSEGE